FTGKMLNETWGKIHFWMLFLGFHGTFLIQHWLGVMGMPRRYADYMVEDGFTAMNQFSTVSAMLLGTSPFLFVWILFYPFRYGNKVLVSDPCGFGGSLEWAKSSPPPRHTFHALSRISSQRLALDLHLPEMVPLNRRTYMTRSRHTHSTSST